MDKIDKNEGLFMNILADKINEIIDWTRTIDAKVEVDKRGIMLGTDGFEKKKESKSALRGSKNKAG